MSIITVKKLGQALLLAAAVFVGTVCLVGCGGGDNPSSGGDNTGGSNNTGGNNTGGGTKPAGNNKCGVDGTADSCKTVEIGGQTWMAENLNLETEESWCYGESAQVFDYKNNNNTGMTLTNSEIQANCSRYGRLYTLSAAKTACQSIGWRLPNRQDWDNLAMTAGGSAIAGSKLKARSGWDISDGNTDGNGTDQYGFSALPGGLFSRSVSFSSGSSFNGAGMLGYWWIDMERRGSGVNSAEVVRMMYSNTTRAEEEAMELGHVVSVRCVAGESNNTVGGGSYESVSIGGKKWMTKNLNVNTVESWCYENADSNCVKYGRLYKWEAAKFACHSIGWRLPDTLDWRNLVNATGGTSAAGKALKSTSGWNNNANGTDDYGFSALPGGERRFNNSFMSSGSNGYWWSATDGPNINNAYRWGISGNSVGKLDEIKSNSYSVRCVADE